MSILGRFKAAPLSSSFFLASILGFLISAVYFNRLGPDYAVTFMVLFGAMFFASMISMTKAPLNAELELDPQLKKYEKY